MNLQGITSISFKLLLEVVVLISCSPAKDRDLLAQAEIPEGLPAKMDSLNKHDPLHGITAKLSPGDCVDGQYTGFAGATSDQYKYYELLQKNAADSQLPELVKQSNVNLKVYALWGLKQRHYQYLASLVKAQVAVLLNSFQVVNQIRSMSMYISWK